MNAGPHATKKKWPVVRTIVIFILVLLTISGIYLYRNFNQLLSDALQKSFNENVISDVYELKFENLQVNIYDGSIRVFNVSVLPRIKPLKDYPYINSSFKLKTENILLERVEIKTLLNENRLILNSIRINKPEIEFILNGTRHVMLPFDKDERPDSEKSKRPIKSFRLNEFNLADAQFSSSNSNQQRNFFINGLHLSVNNLLVEQNESEYMTGFSQVTLGINQFDGHLKKGPIQRLHFADFNLGIDSLKISLALDTVIYRYHDFHTRVNNLEIQTTDSLFQIAIQSFDLSYNKKSIQIEKASFNPNVSHEVIQKKFKYQHTEFSGSLDKLQIKNINFDSAIYAQKFLIEEIDVRNAKINLFKDKTKPLDSTRAPEYLGQSIRQLKFPLRIEKVTAHNVSLQNLERKSDHTEARVSIDKMKLSIKNITNMNARLAMQMAAHGVFQSKIKFTANLGFNYLKPQFTFHGKIDRFNLTDLNPLIQAYTPAKIKDGTADEITFTGIAEEKSASGNMLFLYHNLNIDLELKEQAKWKSSIISFAANTVLNSNNPSYQGLQPREIKFKVERDMNKGFVNVIIKSLIDGIKETMIMSRENRQSYKQAKKKAKSK